MAERTAEFVEESRRKLVEMTAGGFEAKGAHPLNDDVNLLSGAAYGGTDGPHPWMTWLRENAPVYYDPNSDVWALARYRDIVDASRNPEVFSNHHNIRPKTGHVPMLISMDDPEHKQRRKNLVRGFTPRQAAMQTDHVRGIVTDLIDQVVDKGECDFVWDIAAWLPLIVIGDMLGVLPEDRAQLLEWSDLLLRGTEGDLDALAVSTAAFGEYWEYQGRIVADRRKNPQDDLVSVLCTADVEGNRLDDEAIIWESLLILIGGDETTRHVISGGMLELLRRRELFERLRDDTDRELLPRAIDEMLRWVSPIKSMSRFVTQDVAVHGETIPAGDEVLLLYPSGNRDAEIFEHPFTFDLERDPNPHIAFGHGPHFCLGSHVAKVELTVLFDEIFRRMPDLELTADPDELELRNSSFTSGLEALPVKF
jgi:cytochrome P450 family 142 subfamily A polypeptide 1